MGSGCSPTRTLSCTGPGDRQPVSQASKHTCHTQFSMLPFCSSFSHVDLSCRLAAGTKMSSKKPSVSQMPSLHSEAL